MRRGLLGGTFDPFHMVHLIAGELAARQLDLDVVTFLPAGEPWQKADRNITPAAARWEMVTRSIGGVAYFEADDREIRREGPSYTIDTLEEFADDDVVLILGADAAAGLPTWHRSEEILERVSLAVLPRPGTTRADVADTGARFDWLDAPEIPISSTMLRRRGADGLTIRFFVPDAAWHYCKEQGLYGQ
ncbi:MAG: nicotinate (nicotinamide) nucleotide adenylyltransferase [Acidimicrobiia bacterium]|nr:nicotinate (nicotinamide) nucleotide adenylyltransferase [Acidimicrobiia bacterium]